jgi:hypothetical protein
MRWFVITLGAIALMVAALLLMTGQDVLTVLWLLVNGCVLIGAILFERWRYRPSIDRSKGRWQPTSERFVDPGTGRLVDVFYNPDTGERDYVEVSRKARRDPGRK